MIFDKTISNEPFKLNSTLIVFFIFLDEYLNGGDNYNEDWFLFAFNPNEKNISKCHSANKTFTSFLHYSQQSDSIYNFR